MARMFIKLNKISMLLVMHKLLLLIFVIIFIIHM